MSHTLITRVTQEDTPAPRLDVFLTEKLALFPRSQLKQRLQNALVNGLPAKLSRRLKAGDEITLIYTDPPPSTLQAEPMALDIV
ncbi:MAG TPA: RNA pseudouridine synthase, partial [Spirochaetia bacterium]|nr:RNA pseudouridine synthase [Spirochaetia bacterium]